MNVIETVKKILTDCPLMDEFNDNIHIDYMSLGDKQEMDTGVYPLGTSLVSGDILGNKKYHINFSVFADKKAYEDYDRLNNSGFLLSLTYYLNQLKDIAITENVNGEEKNGVITKISAGNGLLFSVPSGDINDGVTYQIQIGVDYTIYK